MPVLQIGDKAAKYPIIQGGMGVGVSGWRLVSAVANCGAIGTLAGAGLIPGELRSEIQKTKRLTKGIFGVNLMVVLGEFWELLQVCIKEKVDFVTLGAGFSKDAIRALNEARIFSFVIVSSLKAARLATKAGAQGIIVEAPDKAGGHLGIQEKKKKEVKKHLKASIWQLLKEIVPVLHESGFEGLIIAAGGILHGWEIKKAFDLGANGVQMATRFAMSEESNFSFEVKKLLQRTKKTKIIISPVGLPIRVVGSQKKKKLPKMEDVGRCERCLAVCKRNLYCILLALRNALTAKGRKEIESALITIGARIDEIKDVLAAAKSIQKLEQEFTEATSQ